MCRIWPSLRPMPKPATIIIAEDDGGRRFWLFRQGLYGAERPALVSARVLLMNEIIPFPPTPEPGAGPCPGCPPLPNWSPPAIFPSCAAARTPRNWFRRRIHYGMPALGLCDRNSFAGVVRGYVAARDLKEVNPAFRYLVGVRLCFADGRPISSPIRRTASPMGGSASCSPWPISAAKRASRYCIWPTCSARSSRCPKPSRVRRRTMPRASFSSLFPMTTNWPLTQTTLAQLAAPCARPGLARRLHPLCRHRPGPAQPHRRSCPAIQARRCSPPMTCSTTSPTGACCRTWSPASAST